MCVWFQRPFHLVFPGLWSPWILEILTAVWWQNQATPLAVWSQNEVTPLAKVTPLLGFASARRVKLLVFFHHWKTRYKKMWCSWHPDFAVVLMTQLCQQPFPPIFSIFSPLPQPGGAIYKNRNEHTHTHARAMSMDWHTPKKGIMFYS